MPLADCIYSDDDHCHKKFNRGNLCLLRLTKPRQCGHKRLDEIENFVFDDQQRYYKRSTNLLIQAMDKLFYSEQRKFEVDEKGRAHRQKRTKMGHFPFIMRNMDSVISMVIHIRKHFGPVQRPIKFLDCGCGVGNVVMMAHFAGLDAYGIEYDPVTLQRGRRLFKQFHIKTSRLFRGDILEYPNYSDYDVLYGYCPMCNGEKEKAFEDKLKLDMKIGAMLCGINSYDDRNCNKIGKERVYFKSLILDKEHKFGLANPKIKVAHEKD